MSDTDKTAAQDLASLKLPELRKLAAERGLRGVSGLRKGDLITALTTGQVPVRAAKEASKAADAPKAPKAEDKTEEKASAPRRAARKASRPAGSAEEKNHDAPKGAKSNPEQSSDQGSEQGDNDADKGGKNDEQRYESRSQARRARRNRARRQEREAREEAKASGHDDQDNNGQDKGNSGNQGGKNDANHDGQGKSEDNQGRHDNGGGNNNGGNNNGGNNRRDNNNRHDDDNNHGGGGRRNRRNRRNRRGRDRDGGGNGGNDLQIREGDEVQIVGGILEVVDNNVAFLRTSGYRAAISDVFVNNNLVRRLGLRSGDALTGKVKVSGPTHTHGNGRNRRKYNQLVEVDTVNGLDPSSAKERPDFAKLTPLYPNQRLRLETDPKILTTRVIDLIMPIGKGQRALIVSPPKAGKTTILQNIANAIAANNPECYLMVVLVDERPEEVTDMQRSVKGEVIASTFDRPPSEHTSVAELAIERAKRLVEQGKDVVVLLDSITRLGRAYNNSSPASGRILSGGVDSNALYPPKRFLGAARNIENGGSLTIIATAMVETGSTGDTVIFEEFKGTGNAELKLDRAISERRIFPAVDVNPSGTRKDELLLVPEEARIMTKLRRILSGLDSFAAIDLLIKQLKKTRSNGEFLMQVASSAPMAADTDEEDYK
ncbi:transcription termination factor Rho [Corynebacterium minutissimum]|uniref:Transcription termination factor Rho n=1 Tax=Corynebacterium minutissimum TaxID=38301 RepID=A0A2X4RE19_9CORY|nr:transcription termination factor Rho [Corynebacterium minutissimum]KHO29587.1 transcription termination factor Rho [Corynebacterium minutissimum]QPS58718.1 transcription termination factor Rho [Corynebacterium minutissimum]QQA80492.1 transcription termination factor Rho [Corynebacterium minutissimum]SQI00169.1 transcription termination factor Rho [Corynebacterium minutissimum]VEG05764.1 transcription termination factor Rho [Corynebacterium minutissimum]